MSGRSPQPWTSCFGLPKVHRIDIATHPMGGLAVRRYLEQAECPVRRVVFLGTPHQGTVAAMLGWGRVGGR